MCNPLMAAAAAMTIGGTMASNAGQQKALAAQNDVIRSNNARQSQIEQDAYAKQAQLRKDEYARQDANYAQANRGFGDTLNRVGADQTKANLEAEMARRADDAASNIAIRNDPAEVMPANQPQVVQDAIRQSQADALARGQDAARRLAKANSFGDVLFGNNVALARGAENQQALQGARAQSGRLSADEMARADQNYRTYASDLDSITPLDLQAAGAKGGGLRTFGDLLKGGGQLAGFAGAMGAGPSWSNLFGSSPGFGGAGGQSARFLAGSLR